METPWDWMQPHDAAMMGDIIFDPAEQTRWCRAVMLGGLPYMWRVKARVVRQAFFDRMDLRSGDRTLLIGESIASCAFVDDIKARTEAQVDVIDITDKARAGYVSGERGRGGQLATWRWDYTEANDSESYDAVMVLQGVQHTDDWRETATELIRLVKPGRMVGLAEITFSPQLLMKAELDLHIEYWLEKVMSRLGWNMQDFPYYSLDELKTAFSDLSEEIDSFSWKGLDMLWARKPR